MIKYTPARAPSRPGTASRPWTNRQRPAPRGSVPPAAPRSWGAPTCFGSLLVIRLRQGIERVGSGQARDAQPSPICHIYIYNYITIDQHALDDGPDGEDGGQEDDGLLAAQLIGQRAGGQRTKDAPERKEGGDPPLLVGHPLGVRLVPQGGPAEEAAEALGLRCGWRGLGLVVGVGLVGLV